MSRVGGRMLLISLLTAICICGCAPIAYLVTIFAPPQKVEAVYKPPKEKKFLVFVDDSVHRVTYEPFKRYLTDELNRNLVENGVARQSVPYERILELSAQRDFHYLSVSEIGQKLDAEMVLYVQVDEFSLRDQPDGHIWRGRLAVSIRIVDVAESRSIWPEDRPAGMPVQPVAIPEIEESSPAFAARLSRMLSEQMADRIAKLFYDYKIDAREVKMDHPSL